MLVELVETAKFLFIAGTVFALQKITGLDEFCFVLWHIFSRCKNGFGHAYRGF
jgi:hypothetical protein